MTRERAHSGPHANFCTTKKRENVPRSKEDLMPSTEKEGQGEKGATGTRNKGETSAQGPTQSNSRKKEVPPSWKTSSQVCWGRGLQKERRYLSG